MVIEWSTIILSSIASLLSAGGIGWIVTVREDKKAKVLENKQKEAELEEYKKDEIIKDWEGIAAERKQRADELAVLLKEHEEREIQKDNIISDLRSQLAKKNAHYAAAKLMRCEKISCPERRPPLGMTETKVTDSFE